MRVLNAVLIVLLLASGASADNVLAQVLRYGPAEHAGGSSIRVSCRVRIVGAGNVIQRETELPVTLDLSSNQTTAATSNAISSQLKAGVLAEFGHTVLRVLMPPLLSVTP